MEILKFLVVAGLLLVAMLLFFNSNQKVLTNGNLSETQSQYPSPGKEES